jgi:hypothetical protein
MVCSDYDAWMYIKVYKVVCWMIYPCLCLYHIFLFHLYLLTKCLSLEHWHDHPCLFFAFLETFLTSDQRLYINEDLPRINKLRTR